MLFINTRPENRAKPLTEFLQNQNVEVIELPLLGLVEKPLNFAEQNLLRNISQTQAIILVSEEAVKYGLSALAKEIDLAAVAQLPITWIAVGEKTANCFSQTWQGLSKTAPPSVTFPIEPMQQNNEGLLYLAQIQSLKQGDSVQLWRGVGGRELLANTLLAKGVDVHLINFYELILPFPTIEKFADLQNQFSANNKKVVVMSSLTAWQHWQQLLANSELTIYDFNYLVLQNRIATMMNADSDICLRVIDDLQVTTIYQALSDGR